MPLPYGMDDGQLLSIINATRDAIGRMNSVNGGVQSQAGTYTSVNNSDSGRTMQERLTTWNEEFTRIVGDLDNLNTKVTNVRANNNDTSGAASGAARNK
jgi:uncharacterized protein YukE